jgi:hypothetical protein|tara:strand:+ start:10752 stop:11513 length:762 start_codon:yes stop_codon:yes gene_type:complete
MSIINKAKERNRSLTGYARKRIDEEDQPTQNPKILDLSKLKDYVEKVVEFNKTKEKNIKNNRKYQYVFEWPIANVLGKVDEPTWVNMIEVGIEWCIDTYTAVQPNGRWEVYDYEVKIENRIVNNRTTVGKDDKGNIQTQKFTVQYDYLILGVEFVDVKGERDLQYDMGRPTTRKDSFDPEMMKLMMKNSPNSEPIVDEESKALIEAQAQKLQEQENQIAALREEQQKSNALMAELLSEMKKSAASSKSTRQKK